MDEPIITFGSESLILEMLPEQVPEKEPIAEQIEIPIAEVEPKILKKSWCILS